MLSYVFHYCVHAVVHVSFYLILLCVRMYCHIFTVSSCHLCAKSICDGDDDDGTVDCDDCHCSVYSEKFVCLLRLKYHMCIQSCEQPLSCNVHSMQYVDSVISEFHVCTHADVETN